MDIGEGIPNTIKKKWIEVLNPLHKDSDLLKVAFTEQGRSETGLSYRGRGLPNLYSQVHNGKLKDFFVISGKGSCWYNQDKYNLECKDYKFETYGTIFSFGFEGGKQ